MDGMNNIDNIDNINKIKKLITMDKMLEHIKIQLPNFPNCKIKEYKYLYKLKIPYKNIQSNQQINTIIKYGKTKKGMSSYNKLLKILSKHIKVINYTKFLNQFLYKKLTDDAIYSILQKHIYI